MDNIRKKIIAILLGVALLTGLAAGFPGRRTINNEMLSSAYAKESSVSSPITDEDELLLTLHDLLVLHTQEICLYYNSPEPCLDSYFQEIYRMACRHDMNEPLGGDYLYGLADYYDFSAELVNTENGYTYEIKYGIPFSTTKEQDEYVDKETDRIIASLKLSGKTDYEKLYAIYDYICKNVIYDYIHVSDITYNLQHTAYGALHEGACVCDGFASLLYVLLLKAGIDCRIITGYASSDMEYHAWNIVKIGDVYYNADCTWDCGRENWNFFLVSDETLNSDPENVHKRSEKYSTDAFYQAYPMSTVDNPYASLIPSFKSRKLLLDGRLGVNFFLDLSGLTAEEKKAGYMEFFINGRSSAASFDEYFKDETGDLYGFTCYLSAVDIPGTITAIYRYGEGKTVEKSFSPADYFDTDLESDGLSDHALSYARAIADYAYYIRYLSGLENKWPSSWKYAGFIRNYTESFDHDAIRSALSDKALQRDYGSSDIEKLSISLYPDSLTSINIYITPKAGYTGEITVNNGAYAARKLSDGRFLVTIPDIEAHRLGDMTDLEFVTDSGTASMSVSAMSYVHMLLGSEKYAGDEDAKNAAAALYNYYKAAAEHMYNV